VLPTQLGVSGYESEKGPERSPFHESRGPKRGHGMGSLARVVVVVAAMTLPW
jgi:hypothetical protein